MSWFNYYGLIFIVVIMIPNIVFALTHKNGFENKYRNKPIEIAEQIGRFGSMAFMVFNIPYCCFGFWFSGANIVYLSINSVFCLLYCVFWVVFWKKSGIAKALILSILPSVVFIFSGIMLLSIPLMIAALIFAFGHIAISYKNAS